MTGPQPPRIDTIPHAAGMQNLLLGGQDHMPSDREAIARLQSFVPVAQQAARENRAFGARVLEYMTQAGIEQVINIGIGLAATDYVHEVVAVQCPDAPVVYVDNDPLVLAYARALIPHTPHPDVLDGDMRRPREFIERMRDLIDFARPVGVLLVAMLHFVAEEDAPALVVEELMKPLAAGSALAISHFTTEGPPSELLAQATEAFSGTATPLIPRSRAQITELMSGLHVVDPGVVDVTDWRPWPGDWPGDPERGIEPSRCLLGAVAVKPEAIGGGPRV